MDTDDINIETRFRLQFQAFVQFPELSVVGGLMEEKSPDGIQQMVRRVPNHHTEIHNAARFRNPLNHPTVMFRRADVIEAGNYQPMMWFEDYFLWARMLQKGYQFLNLDTVLVTTVVEPSYFDRRGGWQYLKREFALTRTLQHIGFHSPVDSGIFMLMRFLFRVMPNRLRSWLYIRALRQST